MGEGGYEKLFAMFPHLEEIHKLSKGDVVIPGRPDVKGRIVGFGDVHNVTVEFTEGGEKKNKTFPAKDFLAAQQEEQPPEVEMPRAA